MGVNLSGQIPDDPGSSNVFGRLGAEAEGLGQAIGGAFNGMMSGIGNALRGVFDSDGVFAPIGRAAQEIRDGQQDIAHRVDLIDSVLNYGTSFIKANKNISGSQVLPFTEQLGPMKGVEVGGNGLVLRNKGLWDLRAQVTVSFTASILFQGVGVIMEIKKPSGEIYSTLRNQVSSSEITSLTLVGSVVVPDPNYTVTLRVDQVIGRGVLGGPTWSRLTAQQISNEMSGRWRTGAEESDQEPSR